MAIDAGSNAAASRWLVKMSVQSSPGAQSADRWDDSANGPRMPNRKPCERVVTNGPSADGVPGTKVNVKE